MSKAERMEMPDGRLELAHELVGVDGAFRDTLEEHFMIPLEAQPQQAAILAPEQAVEADDVRVGR